MALSWTIGTGSDAELVNTMLDNAIAGLARNIYYTYRQRESLPMAWVDIQNKRGWSSSINVKEGNGTAKGVSSARRNGSFGYRQSLELIA